MNTTRLSTGNPHLPRPSGFSYAVRSTAEVIHLAGHTAMDLSGQIVSTDLVKQIDRTLENLQVTAEQAGCRLIDLVSMTIYVTNIEEYRSQTRSIGDVWRLRIGNQYPAMALVEVKRLWDEAAKIEIQATCAITAHAAVAEATAHREGTSA